MAIRKIKLIIDGQTSTSALVKQCLGNEVILAGDSYFVEYASTADYIEKKFKNDILILVRTGDADSYIKTQLYAKIGRPYIYYIDDNFWLLLGTSSLDDYYSNWMVRRALESAVSGASLVLCHSEKFKQFLSNYNQNVKVIPTFFDFSCIEIRSSEIGLDEKRVGIVANQSRATDVAIIIPAIKKILEECGCDIYFEFFGYVPPELSGHSQVRYFKPINDYVKFIKAQNSRNWLLALAPLQENAFSSFKTNNKFREYGGASVAGIYSNVEIYRECVTNDVNGWLVDNTSEAWYLRIKSALNDPEKTLSVGIEARECVLKRHHINEVRRKWVLAIENASISEGGLKLGYLVNRIILVLDKIRSKKGELNIFTKNNGPLSWRLGEIFGGIRHGFFAKDTIYALEAGDSLVTNLKAPFAGYFKWSIVIATFNNLPEGELELIVSNETGIIDQFKYSGYQLKDNQPIQLAVDLSNSTEVEITVANLTNMTLGLYSLSPNGQTVFRSSGNVFPGRFVA